MKYGKKVRERLSMDKDWRFHLGEISGSVEKGHAGIYDFTKAGGTGGPARTDWNDNQWALVNLPHDWVVGQDFSRNESASQGYKPRGIGWYRKLFQLNEADKGKQILLEFDGIATNAKIYFNGSELEQNWCGYTSFAVDVSDRVFWGNKPNTLAVRVYADVWEGWWYEGAGIYRHAWLTKKAPVHIAQWGTWVNPIKMDDLEWETQIETTIENSTYEDVDVTLVSILLDPEGNPVGRAENEAKCGGCERIALKQLIPLNAPDLWDIDSPQLYTLISEVYWKGELVDSEETCYGYRTIRICAETGFYLNEKPLKIKGTCNHQDHAGIGVALPDSIHEYRICRLKEMGSNAYRCAHGNPAKELLDACDNLGMLVMDENRKFESSIEGLKQVESMVRRDRNHPCVVMYSIFNEEPLQGTPQGRAMAKRLIYAIKRLDSTRPVTAAMNGGMMEDEGVADILDITGFNYNLWEYDAFHKKHPHQPVIGSENNCAFSTRGVYVSDKEKQEFNCYDEEKAPWGHTIRETWKEVHTRSFVMGLFVWTGFDYRGEPSPYNWPSISSHWGAMDTCGFAKDAYYLHKACWTDEPMVHMLPHWNWQGMEGKPVQVMSHTNCDEVELFLNGRSYGRKPSPIYEQAVWEVPYQPGRLAMKGYIHNTEVAQDIVETTDEAMSLKLEADRSFLNGDGLDAMPVNVSAVDHKGRFVPTENRKVRFTVTGLGHMLGVGNGDPNCHERDIAEERSLFNGRCQAVLQSIRGAGTMTIRAEADGLEPADLVIEVKAKEPLEAVESVFERFIVGWRMTQQIFSKRPDPNMEINDTDMNTWEPVEFYDGPQNKFNDHVGGYALYRAKFSILEEDAGKPMILKFYKVMGWVEVYINESKWVEEDCAWGKELEIPLKPGTSGVVALTVLIQSNNPSWPFAGICKPVIIKEDENA